MAAKLPSMIPARRVSTSTIPISSAPGVHHSIHELLDRGDGYTMDTPLGARLEFFKWATINLPKTVGELTAVVFHTHKNCGSVLLGPIMCCEAQFHHSRSRQITISGGDNERYRVEAESVQAAEGRGGAPVSKLTRCKHLTRQIVEFCLPSLIRSCLLDAHHMLDGMLITWL